VIEPPDREFPLDRRKAPSRSTRASGKTAPTRRIRPRTAAIGAATLVAAILVVAIGFSSDDLSCARAASELDRALPDPRPSRGPGHEPATDAPATRPVAAAEPAQGASEPAGAAGAARPPAVASPPPDSPPAATPSPAPRSRPRSPATSSSRSRTTREPGPDRPTDHTRARGARPIPYDPDTLFLDKR
jgi:hypothetical protein